MIDGPGSASGPFLLRAKMLTKFEKKVGDYVEQSGLFSGAKKAVLAISGGADSTALLYVMCALKDAEVITTEMISIMNCAEPRVTVTRNS